MRKLAGYPILLVLLLSHLALAESPLSMADYLRYEGVAPAHLDTSVVTMTSPEGLSIDLFAAVHLADVEYYEELNERFKGYDAVLYELVIPDEWAGQKLPEDMGEGGGTAGIQGMMANSMGLSSQLTVMDYSPDNFVHADLTTGELLDTMSRRRESIFSYFRKVMAYEDFEQDADLGVTEEELAGVDFMALLSGTASARDRTIIKKFMATSLASSGTLLSSMNDSALLSSRNVAAMKALDREVDKGHKSFALFYGAAHMPDIEDKLTRKGWTRTNIEWLEAWKI